MSWWTDLWKFLFPPKPTTPPIVTPPPPPPPPPPPVDEGKASLWSATVDGYQSSPLQGCGNDGKNMANYLGPRGFEVHRLREQAVTGAGLEAFWRQAVRETGPNDVTVLHFSGHGANGPSGLPSDPGQNIVTQDMRPFYASRIGRILDEELTSGGTVLIFLDCCHSESGVRLFEPEQDGRRAKSVPWSELDTSQDPVPSLREHREYNLVALARSPGNGIVEFAACQANDVTYDARIVGPDGVAEIQGCATRAWLDSAMELDARTAFTGGYSVADLQAEVQTRLPNDEFPNRPQLWASEEGRHQPMWKSR